MVEHARDEKAIFLAALEKTTPEERNAFLEGACAGDSGLLERVKELQLWQKQCINLNQ